MGSRALTTIGWTQRLEDAMPSIATGYWNFRHRLFLIGNVSYWFTQLMTSHCGRGINTFYVGQTVSSLFGYVFCQVPGVLGEEDSAVHPLVRCKVFDGQRVDLVPRMLESPASRDNKGTFIRLYYATLQYILQNILYVIIKKYNWN